MKNIAVIGSGTMGNGIAHTFAQFGNKVMLVDINQEALDKGIGTISKNLDRQVAKGIISEEEKASTLFNITGITAIDSRLADIDLVVEAASENFEIK